MLEAWSKLRWSARRAGFLAAEAGFTPVEAELDEDAGARTRSSGARRAPRLNR